MNITNISTFIKYVIKLGTVFFVLKILYKAFKINQKLKNRHKMIDNLPIHEKYTKRIIDRSTYDKNINNFVSNNLHNVDNILDLADPTIKDIYGESISFVASGYSLLIQLAHPYVGHAIASHSSAIKNPYNRFNLTFKYVFGIIFAHKDDALKSSKIVRSMHDKISDKIKDFSGRYYDIDEIYSPNDLEALILVHNTLEDGMIFMYTLLVNELDEKQKQKIHEFHRQLAVFYGIPINTIPESYQHSINNYYSLMISPNLHPTESAIHVANCMLVPTIIERYVNNMFGTKLCLIKSITGLLLPNRLSKMYKLEVKSSYVNYALCLILAIISEFYKLVPKKYRSLSTYNSITGVKEDILHHYIGSFVLWFVKKSLDH